MATDLPIEPNFAAKVLPALPKPKTIMSYCLVFIQYLLFFILKILDIDIIAHYYRYKSRK